MTYVERVRRFKQRLILRALRIARGDVSKASTLLTLERTAFYKTLQRAGLKIEDFRSAPEDRPLFKTVAARQSERPRIQRRKLYFGVDVT